MSENTQVQDHPTYPSATPAPATVQLTPYQAAGWVNVVLELEGLDKRIPPQMMYNYTTARINKGKAPLIKATKNEETGKVTIDPADLKVWFETYLAKVKALAAL